MSNLIVADGASSVAGMSFEGFLIWGIAIIVAFILVRFVLRVVRKLVGVALIIAAIVLIGGGGLGVLTGIIG